MLGRLSPQALLDGRERRPCPCLSHWWYVAFFRPLHALCWLMGLTVKYARRPPIVLPPLLATEHTVRNDCCNTATAMVVMCLLTVIHCGACDVTPLCRRLLSAAVPRRAGLGPGLEQGLVGVLLALSQLLWLAWVHCKRTLPATAQGRTRCVCACGPCGRYGDLALVGV